MLALSRSVLLQHNVINRICYYTARVKPRFRNDEVHVRQDLYLRALASIPCLEIVYGTFLDHVVEMPLAVDGPPEMVRVKRTDEKGTDVNLATQLVADANTLDFGAAVVVTNDSDQVAPIRHLVQDLHLPVGAWTPERDGSKRSYGLRDVASFFKALSPRQFETSQFPDRMRDAIGDFSKPPRWRMTDA